MTPEQAIFQLITAVSGGVPVIFADENGRRPPKPYIQLRVQTARRFPLHRGAVDGAGQQLVIAHRDAAVELQCFGRGSYDALDRLGQRLGTDAALAEAERLDLAVFDVGKISQVPVLRDQATYEPRALLELGVRYAVTLSDAVGVVEQVVFHGAVTGGATGTVPVDVTTP
ncbi:phage neck terminator protein [Cupriavidus alkaliphilus]|uniref:phage neck terminator protein n=1 Tax=Cupriavidus alkaliphilus TaxID=942866 RepID=UPI00161C28A4|nr:hypothetical protein [Cupriavidus alkaliphilus]MBB2918331.1 hypothetical protein [Cupriavidus alkaliphilus]